MPHCNAPLLLLALMCKCSVFSMTWKYRSFHLPLLLMRKRQQCKFNFFIPIYQTDSMVLKNTFKYSTGLYNFFFLLKCS